jgi:hypothetical protein
VHGNPNGRNFFLTNRKEIAAIIDWTRKLNTLALFYFGYLFLPWSPKLFFHTFLLFLFEALFDFPVSWFEMTKALYFIANTNN